ncbi:MAG: phosphoribosylformylglycinamidine synthase subunit PurL [Candidatus Micrarchaeota archaeon]|nr:phosphoribosylformylglycinamidine synthase subunit PurL [Candidatus Micrarchaeota archaeon]
MACRIEVGVKPELEDPVGEALLRRVKEELKIAECKKIRVVSVYAIDEDLQTSELELLGKELFADPVTELFSINAPLFGAQDFDFAAFVCFKPKVKDNTGDTSKEAIEDLLGKKIAGVHSGKQYLFCGSLSRRQVEEIAKRILANELIQRFEVKSSQEYGKEGFGTVIPKVEQTGGGRVETINLDVPDKKLAEISRQRLLSLNLEEMKKIKAYFRDPRIAAERKCVGLGPNPTDAEIECIAQTWSEHCKHKIFNAKIKVEHGRKKTVDSLFKTYIKGATEKLRKKKRWLVSVFSDNAGIIEFVPGWNIAMKVETHNTPSALDPFGGALTGILGVNRDVLAAGLGAKPIFNTDVFCFAPPSYEGEIPPKLFHPRQVMEGVRAGVANGGNASGIPTVNGAICFDERYLGKPLVYCGTCGIMPQEIGGKKTHQKAIMAGDKIFMVGGRVGKDGIHGATFSSVELHEESPVSAVQLGDPYTQKKMVDFLLQARDRMLYRCIQDNGAGGLSSSVGEMAQMCGGARLHLDRAPLKYAGLDPWEILLSESQERMTVAVPPEKAQEFVQLAYQMGVEVSELGEFTNSGFFHVLYGAKTVAYIGIDFLHNGVPQMKLSAKLKKKKLSEPPEKLFQKQDYSQDLLCLLSRPNICSKEEIIRQYDHEVQGSSVIKPLCGANADGPSDGAVVAPLLERKEGLVVANGICPRYSDIDCYQMAANAVDEAVRNYVAVGGMLEHLALLDNFCWADPIYSQQNPEGKHRLAQLVEACRGLYDACMTYGLPLISGKDSMKNDYRFGKWKISVPPTLLISAIGKIEDITLAQTSDFKSAGDSIYLLGETKNELGGSEYYAMKGFVGANVPKVDFKKNLALYRKLQKAIRKGLISSCHDCSEGGMAVALAECCMGGEVGAEIELAQAREMRPYQLLFSESAGRFIVSVKPSKEGRFKAIMKGAKMLKIGKVIGEKALRIKFGKEKLIDVGIEKMKEHWKRGLK